MIGEAGLLKNKKTLKAQKRPAYPSSPPVL